MAEESKPSRGVAVALGIFGPLGIGQFYLGQTKRALLWLTVPTASLMLVAVLISPMGKLVGFGFGVAVLFLGGFGVWIASIADLHRIPDEKSKRTPPGRVFAYWFLGVVFALFTRNVLRWQIVEAFAISSSSAGPALLAGDHIFIDKMILRVRAPKRGEIIVFASPEHPDQNFVCRVIAISGDTLETRGGHPWINGWEVPHCVVGTAQLGESIGELDLEFLGDEAYLTFHDRAAATPSEAFGPHVVGAGEYWVLGDNRDNSYDSRKWFDGKGAGVPSNAVRGLAMFRWLRLTKEEGLDWSSSGTSFAQPLLPREMRSLEGDVARCLQARPSPGKTLPPG